MIEHERYRAAIWKLKRDIRPQMDGTLTPDYRWDDFNDWITDPRSQQDLCAMIDDLIAYLETVQ